MLLMMRIMYISDFLSWKESEEDLTTSHYAKRRPDSKCMNGDKRRMYYCHRSGLFVTRGKGVRALKIQGSCKTGARCLASMAVRIMPTGTLSELIVKKRTIYKVFKLFLNSKRIGPQKECAKFNFCNETHIYYY